MEHVLTHIWQHIIEFTLLAVAVVAMVKVAKVEKRPRWLWGGLTFVLGFACTYLDYLPYLRILIVAVLVFVVMMVCNMFRTP
jgi:large-conductance mechanosensitive channel